ncbi:ectonucleotide pyrophosphatase/phosphodiesterase [Candidatus Neomarinimicrobiota bacterium]
MKLSKSRLIFLAPTFLIFFSFLFFIQFKPLSKNSASQNSIKNTIILVSLDGFRWDYIERTETPNLDFLIANGVRAKSLIPVFPSKTFPNHYTIVTGLYAENHGIIANTMYDSIFEASFSLGDRNAVAAGRWWGGEPIWVTAEKNNIVTSCNFWPGSEAEIQGYRPTYWEPYDGDVPNAARINKTLDYLDIDNMNRPSFYTLYFSDLDDAGHQYGPDSSGVYPAIQKVDSEIGQLLDGLRERGILDSVNLMIVSDHGMSQLSSNRIIYLDDYLIADSLNIINLSPYLDILVENESVDSIFNILNGAHPKMSIYKKPDVPEYLHFSTHNRIPPIIGIADDGWSITTRSHAAENTENHAGGTHGYDPFLSSMQGIFIARGPAFKSGLTVDSFQNIHLYNLMSWILEIESAPNDGSLDSLIHILIK